jgi:DNA-binding PadR family transcriptional regulator
MKTETNGDSKRPTLTTPDLVLLSLLAERPMHGYQANLELERRCVRDWAAISKPQVYYSLEKLAHAGLIQAVDSSEPAGGPERTVFETTIKGCEALRDVLEHEDWATQRDRPPFLTWMALSWQARPGVFLEQLDRRRKFLLKELKREKETLNAIFGEVGHKYHEAVWMVSLMILQLRTELLWTKRLERQLERRAKAKNPAYVGAILESIAMRHAGQIETSSQNETAPQIGEGRARK